MAEIKFQMRCPSCGAVNRVRYVTGIKVRIRCGSCRSVIPVTGGKIVRLGLWSLARSFFGSRVPLFLLAALDALFNLLGLLWRPFFRIWLMLPPGVRQRIGWGAIVVLLAAYMLIEGALKLTSLLMLVLLLALAMIVLLIATQGPAAFFQLARGLSGRIFRFCPSCGHRYFAWVRRCPRCGE